MRYQNNKRIVIINTIAIFFAMFLFSNIYKWLPNFFTAALFPVNESLFEHLKLMYVSFVLVSFITFIVLKKKKVKINNYFLATLISILANILIFFLIYLPLYNRLGENLVMTMGLYLITLIISEYIFYKITTKLKHHELFNSLSLVLIPTIWCVLIYFTFNPIRTDFFFDPIEEIYGIK